MVEVALPIITLFLTKTSLLNGKVVSSCGLYAYTTACCICDEDVDEELEIGEEEVVEGAGVVEVVVLIQVRRVGR